MRKDKTKMNLIKEIIINASHTRYLQKKYQAITGWNGILGSFFGIFLTGFIATHLLPVFGVDMNQPVNPEERSIVLILIIFFALFTILIGILVYLAIFSCFMYVAGKFTKSEAKYYTLRSRYPRYWYTEEYKYLAVMDEDKTDN